MELYNDCGIKHMKTMEERSVDLFVLDLPYSNKKFGKCTAMGWDTPIDLDEMWIQIKRIMKPSAVIIFFCNVKFGYNLIHSNPKWFRYDIIWKKSKKVGFLQSNKMPLRQHESIYIFADRTTPEGIYNPQMIEREKKLKMKRKGKNKETNLYAGNPTSLVEESTYTHRHPTSILEFNNPSKSIHRTQKPTSLLEWLIKSYSNEGDIVMDFTMGSGSAGLACLETNRFFIGVEKNKEIFNVAYERIKNYHPLKLN